jgi:cytidylate kinase
MRGRFRLPSPADRSRDRDCACFPARILHPVRMSVSTPTIVAIDGPSASGKSTVTRRVAQALGCLYVDSGAVYRGFTWHCLRRGVDTHQPELVKALLALSKWEFRVEAGAVKYTIDGGDPGEEIRGPAVRENVSYIARVPEVRHVVTHHLRDLSRFGSLAMEGRDIGSAVFPDTPHKFYLDASPEERARRRSAELVQREGASDVAEVKDSLLKRDQIDSTRATAPLQIPLGARVIDSTGLSPDDVVALILASVRGA